MVLIASDGLLEGNATTTINLAWPTGADTRPPTLEFRSTVLEIPEDGNTTLGPVGVRFGDGRSPVVGSMRCSEGALSLDEDAEGGGVGVVMVEGRTGEDNVAVRGLPRDVSRVLSNVTFEPPEDWSSEANGVVTLSIDVEAPRIGEVRQTEASPCVHRRGVACGHPHRIEFGRSQIVQTDADLAA